LIGAEGTNSKIRNDLFGEPKFEYTGYETSSLVLNTPCVLDYENRAFEWWGITRLLIFPLSNSEIGVCITTKIPNMGGNNKKGLVVLSQFEKLCKGYKGLGII
jgi:2-polyprenyl-6-methoxyphenol hydroxylase-like FAD-dependent oxidoreductase